MQPGHKDGPPNFTRREFLRYAALMAGGAATAYLFYGWRGLVDFATATFQGPEKLGPNPFEVGFTTHAMDVDENGKPGLETFKKHIDLLKASKQQWVRMDLRPWHMIKGGTPDKIDWNEENPKIYGEAISYARQNGIKLIMHVFGPDFASEYPPDQYNKVIRNYFEYLAERYSPKNASSTEDIWQIFNEADLQTFRKYIVNYSLPSNKYYLAELATAIKTANDAIKSKNPNAKTTVNLAHFADAPWGGPDAFMARAAQFCDVVAGPIDYISIDPYPYRDENEIRALPTFVSFLKERYKKDVIIAELGAPGGIADYSEEEQAKLISRYLSALRGGRVSPKAVILYQLEDEKNKNKLSDAMGVLNYKGPPKKSFTPIMESMQPPLPPPPPTPRPMI